MTHWRWEVTRKVQISPSIVPSGRLWLLAALVGSLAGDVFLLFPGYFVPGLVAFLLAHVAYLVLLRQGVGWFPSRRALAATLGVGRGHVRLPVDGWPAGRHACSSGRLCHRDRA
jgi:uncharacterized membrane protein YhhN